MQVTSPFGNALHHNENATVGQFAFTTAEAGNYLACFWIDSAEKGSGVSVNLDWKIGFATKDWDAIAKKEKIEVGRWNMNCSTKPHFCPSVMNSYSMQYLVLSVECSLLFLMQGVELELRKLEVAVQAIHQNLIYLKARQVISSTCLE